MPARQGRGCFATLFVTLVLGVAVLYGVIAVTNPWAFHIGGRWTPLLYWSGSGKLLTKSGTYPLYVSFFPASHFSRLHLDGQRPTGGLQGSGWLCTSRGAMQSLELSGTIYGGWRSTEGSLMNFRLLERRIFNSGQRRGFFNLYGRWQGPQLVMQDRGELGSTFRSGLKIERASVTLDWGRYSDFKAMCAANAAAEP
ncbi:MAG TPA: hypothetical protein VGR48_10915 [Terriglobales bacterium]|nr:hypothetical protein [Terriglobales bacterium]